MIAILKLAIEPIRWPNAGVHAICNQPERISIALASIGVALLRRIFEFTRRTCCGDLALFGLLVVGLPGLLARCWLDKLEINRWLVDQGWAVSFGGYQGDDRQAKRGRKGIWAGELLCPADWRADIHEFR